MNKRAPGYVLDREELPFTEEEIFRALALLWPRQNAKRVAAHLAEIAPDYVRYRSRRRARWRRHGDHYMGPMYGWVLPDELFPLLTLVSADAAARVERFMSGEWGRRREALVFTSRIATAKGAGLIPTYRQILARLKKDGISLDDSRLKQGLMVSGPPLPKATATMVAAAEKKLAAEIRSWRAGCNRLRARVSRSHRKRVV